MVMAFYAADLIFSTSSGLGTIVVAVFALAVIGAMVAAIQGPAVASAAPVELGLPRAVCGM
jgi:hypothetical protein